MEKTIEERAENYLDEQFEGWESPDILQLCKDAYIRGATDQYEIDIEKTCDYFMKFNVDAPIKVDVDSWRQFITRILGE